MTWSTFWKKTSESLLSSKWVLIDSSWHLVSTPANLGIASRFYAPWCKTCQRLGLQFQRLAMELGDGIASRQKVNGPVRFAEIAYSPETNHFIQDQLQVEAVPTLQLYHGLNKLWQRSGTKDTKDLREQVYSLEQKSREDLVQYAELKDDGILQHAIDDSFYDSPSFLDEEW